MKDLAHRILSNTWAVVVLLCVALACATVLLLTHTLTVGQFKAAATFLLVGAGSAWWRGSYQPKGES